MLERKKDEDVGFGGDAKISADIFSVGSEWANMFLAVTSPLFCMSLSVLLQVRTDTKTLPS